MSANKYTFKKIFVITVWILLGAGTLMLLVAAITKKNNEQITGIEINITGVQNNYFIDKKDVIKILEKANGAKLENATASSLDLSALENDLQNDQWIKSAEMFFDNNNVLQIKIMEREPVARIFTVSGFSFYMDSSLTRLPLSNKFSARLPVFTNFPTDVVILTKQDSLLLSQVKILSEFIISNPFWMAQIDQIDITPAGTFELIPKLGNQIIRFGSANNYEEKFNKLLAFYKQVQTKTGWNRYSILDLQFKNQVVGVNRNAQEIKTDSLRTIQIMKNLIAEAQKSSNDSLHVQLSQPDDDNGNINNSHAIETVPDENAANSKKTKESKIDSSANRVPEKAINKTPTPVKRGITINRSSSNGKPRPAHEERIVVKKPELKKGISKQPGKNINQQPKAVMTPKSDY
ncbi:MAG: hypothetical protein M3Z26_04410 [Bacteroidota bacterium]|nr:hypothetical protein [Bacteroidota bacterium]